MSRILQKTFAVGLFAVGLPLAIQPVLADPVLPNLTNLNFLSTVNPPKASFGTVDPTGWTGGTGLIFIDAPGTSNTSPVTACGPTYLQTYGCPSTLAIHGGYNEVEADGNPDFESGFNYTVTGLTPKTTYTLSFYQAASQQTGFSGATTEQWIVSLGTSGLTDCAGCLGGGNSSYSNADTSASTVATTLMHTPSQGMTDWNFVSINLTADATSDVLSFLAWGNNGNTANLPPIVFLAGVNSPSGLTTPEPGSLALIGISLVGLGWGLRRRRATKV
jgi:PEP-CTERM motif-containing protein